MKINAISGYTPSYVPKNTLNTNNQSRTSYVDIPSDCKYTNNGIAFQGNKSLNDYATMRSMQRNFSPEAEHLFNEGKKVAKTMHSNELETWHLYLASLIFMKNYINDMDKGIIKYDEESRYKLPFTIQSRISPTNSSLAVDEERAKILEVVNEHIKSVREEFGSKPVRFRDSIFTPPVQPSKNTIGDLNETYDLAANAADSNNFYDSYFYLAASYSHDRRLVREAMKFAIDLQKALMVDDKTPNKKYHLNFYDDKADAIWKNINIGSDVIFLRDKGNSESSQHLISSFVNLINKPGVQYKNIDPEKTDIIALKDNATFEFMGNLVKEVKNDPNKKDRKTIIIADLFSLIKNSNGQVLVEDLEILNNQTVKGKPEVRFVFAFDPETYQANTKPGTLLQQPLSSYAVQTLPTLSEADAIKYLTDKNGLRFVKSETKNDYAPETVKKVISLASKEDGNYPDKAIRLLSLASKYYEGEREITPELLERYFQETRGLSEIQSANNGSSIIFDTGKRLSDIVGSPMTKADAESIVKQIKSGKMGTKGFTAFLENGSSYGGGRRHTAEAIAGEAGIPMIVINAQDFALKDIDALSENADLSEMKIKKIVQSAKAQAEANPNRAAMIFIENFDNFAADPLYSISSIYEKKAFSQLLSEMENARKNDDINLVIVGSVNNPALIDQNVMKPYKFLNSIIVFPPQDTGERKEVLDYYIEKMGLKIAGESEDEREKIIKYAAETTSGFTVVDIMYLLETVKNVANERGKEKIDTEDFTEAYLQTVSGRTNKAHIAEPRKKIVTSHEAGHALCLQIMYEIAEEQNIPWHLPDKLNFITLDPRGDFGGAMFHKASDNQEYNFETMMSDIICSFGGHSSEKIIYNMPGSWGITADIHGISSIARAAVLDMGMGPRTGVCHIQRNGFGSPDVSEAKKVKIEQDIDSFVKTGNEISDLIVKMYKDFIIEFTERHYKKVGTGKCVISSEEFKKELNEWREKQSESKKAEIEAMKKEILSKMKSTKEGK